MPFNTFGGGGVGGGSPVNPNWLAEVVGGGVNGAGMLVAAHASVSTIGASVDLGATAAAWTELEIFVASPSTSNTRYLVYISLNGEASYLPPLYFLGTGRFRLPLNVASGAHIWAKVQSATGGATVRVMAVGKIASGSGNPPGFTICEAVIPAVTGTTSASATAVTPANNTTLANIGSVTAQRYGAFLAMPGTTSVPSTSRNSILRLGAGSSLVHAADMPIGAFTDSLNGFNTYFAADVAAGVQMKAGIESPNTDGSILLGLLGFR